jgi:hypothetical protein
MRSNRAGGGTATATTSADPAGGIWVGEVKSIFLDGNRGVAGPRRRPPGPPSLQSYRCIDPSFSQSSPASCAPTWAIRR